MLFFVQVKAKLCKDKIQLYLFLYKKKTYKLYKLLLKGEKVARVHIKCYIFISCVLSVRKDQLNCHIINQNSMI